MSIPFSQERQIEDRDHEVIQAALACVRRRKGSGDSVRAASSKESEQPRCGNIGGEVVLEELRLSQEQVRELGRKFCACLPFRLTGWKG